MRKKQSVLLLAILAFVVVACKKKVDPEFSFDKETVTINIDETYELEYSLTKDFDVEFVLSKEGIVSITGDTIKGLASGEVVITGTIKDTEVSATITIIVREKETPVVNVESVNIAGATEGFIDVKVTLTATVLPANATNKTVTWQSSDEELATVANGVVTLLSEGSVTITASAGGKSDTHVIAITEKPAEVIPVESVAITGDMEGFVGDTVNLTATVLPENATDKTVTWESSDEEVATVANGVVTLLKAGTVTITATAGEVDGTHEIVITNKVVLVESVEITGDMEGFVGDTVNLTATVLPENATDKTVTWESSDETLATVTNGAVKLLKAGTVTITATSGEVSDTHVITIENVLVESVAITGDTEGMVDDEITLLATVLPANATDKTVTWESSDEELATVENGVVTLLGVGTVTITATSGEFEATHEITIAPKPILVETIEITGESKGFVGDEITLTATVLPEDADDKTVTWDVNVSAFATVEDGVVTLLRPGKVLVYVTSGDVSVEFEITIQTVAATIGENIFATIQDAIDAAEENDVITVSAGTHNEALTINKSNISFVPETGKEVTLTNLITIAHDDSLENISFSNFNFTGDAQFKSVGILKGFEFRNNYVYDTNLEASAYAPINRLNINAFIQFYRLADGDLFGDIFIEDNVFENVQSDIISLDRTMSDTQISIMNNEFRNYGITAVRFDGGWNNGVYNIKNNIFENDELSAFSAITFRAISPLAGNTQHIYIEENIFTNIGTPSKDRDGYHPGSGVITHSTYNGTPTNMYIRDNVFNHTFNSVHLNVTNSNFTHEISGNIFNDPIGYTFFKSGSTESYVNNTYYDRLGVEVAAERVITTVETDFISVHIEDPVLEGFTIVGENTGEVTDQITLALEATPPYFLLENVVWTSSDDELATVEDGVVTLLQAGTVTITAQYEDMEETFEITISEKVAAFIGEVEYATIQAAIDAAQDDDVINVNKGVFNEELTINKPLTLNGFSEGKSFLTEKVTIEAGLINVTITGFSMTGNFQVRSVGKLTNFTFTNNYVFDTELLGSGYVPNSRTNVNAIIQLYAGTGANAFGDIFIEDNIFDNIQSDIIAIDRTMKDTEISIRNNDFLNFRIGAIRFDGGYNNGTYNIIGNKFENDQKQASAAITFRAYAPETIAGNVQTINILDNTFINIGNEQSNPVDSYPASAVIGTSTFNSNPIDFNITNNMFVNTHNTVHLRKGGDYDNNTWDVDITNNTFQNTTGFMYREDGEIALFAENIYLDETGNPVSEEKVSDEATSTLRIVRIVPEIAEYVVVYYTFNADTNRYDVVEETFSGIVGTTITIVAEPPLGFYSEELEYVGVIEANGSLVIEVFYEVYLDAFRYELELNGGNTLYATRDEMVDDWIADYNEYGGTSYTIESLPMGAWVNIDIHTFFYDQRFREKWLWVAQYLAVVGSSTNKGSAAAIVSRDTVSAFEGANVNYKYAFSYEVRGFMAGRKYVENANWQSADYSDSGLKFGFWESLINGRQETEFLSTSAEVVLPTEVYLENYEFLGWYDNPDFEGEVYLVLTEEKTLYAKFEEKDPVTDLIIDNEIIQLIKGAEHQLEITILPEYAHNKTLLFYTSDDKVASVSPEGLITANNAGDVTIKVTSHNGNVEVEMDITVVADNDVSVKFTEGFNGNVNVGDLFGIEVTGFGEINSGLVYTLSVEDENVLELTETNEFKALAVGTTQILIQSGDDLKFAYTVIVQPDLSESRVDQLLEILANANNPVAKGLNVITYYTAMQEWSDPRHESVNLYLFDEYVVDSTTYPADPTEFSNKKMTSVEFVLVHDTANLSGGLANHGSFFQNRANGIGIHYTTGDYGIVASLPDDYVGWHAGDGTGYSFEWHKTGIMANDNSDPLLDISTDGYFTFDGQKSTVLAPTGKNGEILDRSYFTYQGPSWDIFDGEYVIATTWFATNQQARGVIGTRGGNERSIGIEMNVNRNADIIDTVQRTAKLVANLLEENDLDNRRVIMHNTTDGKGDPYTLNNTIYEGTWYFDRFMEHVAVERDVLANFPDAVIEFSTDSDLVSDTGRVISMPEFTTEVEYTITVTIGEETKSITLVSVIPGVNTWNQNYGFFAPTQAWAKAGYRS